MKKSGWTVMLLVTVMLACEPDPVPENTPEQIKTGTSEGMLVNRMDSLVIGAYHTLANCDLDIDGNLTPDFRLSSEVWGSPGMGQHPRASLMSLNENALFHGRVINDSTFFYTSEVATGVENGTPVYVTFTRSWTCERVHPDDSVVSVNPDYFAPGYHPAGTSILRSDTYRADTITLNDGYSCAQYSVEYRQDTIIGKYDCYHRTCYSIPGERIWYIGIKLIAGNQEKIGWIKMGVMDSYKILVLETAVIEL